MSERVRWADADIDVVELLAFGFGMAVGGVFGVVAVGFGIRWLAGVPVLTGLWLTWRAIRAGSRRPWWRTPDSPGSGYRRDRGDDDG